MPVLPAVAHMKPGDHYCGIYRTDEDKRAFVTDFVREGVSRREKIVYLVNVQTAAQLKEMLVAGGLDVDPLIETGQLEILTAKDEYIRDGEFDPEKMVALLREQTEKALAAGYSAMRATGEMTWALAGEPGAERLVEYEAMLNRFFPNSECYGVCQYDLRLFDSEMLLDILHTHPKVLYGKQSFDNSKMYYVPPELFLDGDRSTATLEARLNNLSARPPVAG